MEHYDEEPLGGGNINPTVARVGDTVRRAVGTHSQTVQSLLRHLEAQGFSGCPRFLGMDAQGREALTFLPGEVGFMPYLWDDVAPLVAAARLLRDYHDATAGFAPGPDARWGFVYPDARRHEVICHNDFAPYNLVCMRGVPYAMIDFDMAGPGPRLRDVAYAAFWLAPLWSQGELSERARADREEGSRRLCLFCHAYGIAATPGLLDMVESVLQFLGDWLEEQAARGSDACQRIVAEGGLAGWRRESEGFRSVRPMLEYNLMSHIAETTMTHPTLRGGVTSPETDPPFPGSPP